MNEIDARSRWARLMLDRCETPPPLYGSAEWLRLPEGDIRRVGAVVTAAESWARAGDELVETLRAEVALASLAHKRAEDADYEARAAEHRDEWGHLSLVRGAYADSPEFHSGGRTA